MKAKTIIKTASSKPVLGILKILLILAILILTNCSGDDGGEPAASDPSSSSDAGASLSSSGGGVADTSSSSVDEESSSSGGGSGYTGEYGSLTYQDKTYRTVEIGEQVWMAENLNYAAEGSKCYGDDEANCELYGRLYDWATAMGFASSCNADLVGGDDCGETIETKHRGVCPEGWHIPTNAEWDELYLYAEEDYEADNGGYITAGKHLKATSGWNEDGNGLDSYGFAALPGGLVNSGGSFSSADYGGYWWSASEDDADDAYGRYMYYDREGAYWSNIGKTRLFSVRCVQD